MGNIQHFDRALLPPAKTFFEREIGQLTRSDRRGNALGRCPFHQSKSGKSFSVNIQSGLWYCHGCSIGGDIITFVRRRYRLDFGAAKQYLGIGDITAERARELRLAERERKRQEARRAEQAEAERQQRIETRNHLHMLEGIYDTASTQLGELRGHPGGQSELCWELMADVLPEIRECESLLATLRFRGAL